MSGDGKRTAVGCQRRREIASDEPEMVTVKDWVVTGRMRHPSLPFVLACLVVNRTGLSTPPSQHTTGIVLTGRNTYASSGRRILSIRASGGRNMQAPFVGPVGVATKT